MAYPVFGTWPTIRLAGTGNAGAVPASLMITFLLPKGAPLSTPAAAMPGLPRTGAGGAPAWAELPVQLLALAALPLALGASACLGRWLRRPRRD